MAELNGSKTQDNLKEAFAGESQANRRYLYFAQKADIEGYPDVADPVPPGVPRRRGRSDLPRPLRPLFRSNLTTKEPYRCPISREARRTTT